MSKVVDKSPYAIKLDSLKNDWEIVDKSLIKTNAFKSLKIGDYIQIMERGKQEVIKDFRYIQTWEVEIRWEI